MCIMNISTLIGCGNVSVIVGQRNLAADNRVISNVTSSLFGIHCDQSRFILNFPYMGLAHKLCPLNTDAQVTVAFKETVILTAFLSGGMIDYHQTHQHTVESYVNNFTIEYSTESSGDNFFFYTLDGKPVVRYYNHV